LLLAAGTDSAVLPHDEEGPCAGYRGILFAIIFSFVLSIYFDAFEDLGFLFSNSFLNSLSQDAQSSSPVLTLL
jgi:hypothetical protein